MLRAGAAASGNAGLAPAAAAHPAPPGFKQFTVIAIDHESADVLSVTMQSPDSTRLASALPGQYVILRIQGATGGVPLARSYLLSGPPSTGHYRIRVKVDPHGAAGTYLREHIRVGDSLSVNTLLGRALGSTAIGTSSIIHSLPKSAR